MLFRNAKIGVHYQGVVGRLIVNAKRSRFAFGVAGEIVHVDFLRIDAPNLPGVFEIAYQFTLLGVHADDRLAVPPEQTLDPLNEAILPITVRVRLSGQPFDVGPKGIIHSLEQAADRLGGTLSQPFRQGTQAAAGVFRVPFGITAGFRINQFLEILLYGGEFFLIVGRPPPARLT